MRLSRVKKFLARLWSGRRRRIAARRAERPACERLEPLMLMTGGPYPIGLPYPADQIYATDLQEAVFPLDIITNQPRPTQNFSQFDPRQGTLVAAEVSATGILQGSVTIENLSPNQVQRILSNIVTTSNTGFTMDIGSLSPPLSGSTTTLIPSQTVTMAPYDGVQDFFGPDSVTVGPSAIGPDPILDRGIYASLNDNRLLTTGLNPYVGSGTVPVTYLPTGSLVGDDENGNFAYMTQLDASARATIRYFYVPFSVSGTIFCDSGLDGQYVPGTDEPLSAVTVTLTGTDAFGNQVSETTTTDASGAYQFNNLPEGTYTVTQTTPSGFLNGSANPQTVTVNTSNPSAANTNFADIGPGTISGVVREGAIVGGVTVPTEKVLPGSMVTLSGTDFRGQAITPVTVTTDAQGAYSFPDTLPGTYTVSVLPPNAQATQQPLTATLGLDSCGMATRDFAWCYGSNMPDNELCISVTPTIQGIHNQNSQIVLSFSDPLDPTSAQNLSYYRLVSPGRDGKLGTADDRAIPIRSATYDASTQSVTLRPAARLALNQAFLLTVRGGGGVVQNSPAGPADGLLGEDGVCGDYSVIFQRGTHLHYSEADNDRVTLGVSRGGVMTLFRRTNGDAARLLVQNGTSQGGGLQVNAFLQGSVTRRPTGNGTALIPVIEAARPIRLNLPSSITVGQLAFAPGLPDAALPGGGILQQGQGHAQRLRPANHRPAGPMSLTPRESKWWAWA